MRNAAIPIGAAFLVSFVSACDESRQPSGNGGGSGTRRDGGPRDSSTSSTADAGEELDGGGGGGDAGSLPEPSRQCNDLLEAACRYVVRCESKLGFAAIISEGVICHPFARRVPCGELDRSVARGLRTYSAAQAATCMRELGNAPCTLTGNVVGPAACRMAYAPAQRDGEECYDHDDCISGRCDESSQCPGTCASRAAVNAACAIDEDCQDGLHCDMGTCKSMIMSGGACVAESGDDKCANGLWCAADMRCRAYGRNGDPCRGGGFAEHTCEANLLCENGRCAMGGAAGATCDGMTPCAVGARCAGEEGMKRCVQIAGPGQACTSPLGCPLGYTCGGGRCQPQPIAGQACSDTLPCLQGACQGAVCRPLPAGSSCEDDQECEGHCSESICVAYLGLGGDCNGPGRCGPGLTCDATNRCAAECVVPQ